MHSSTRPKKRLGRWALPPARQSGGNRECYASPETGCSTPRRTPTPCRRPGGPTFGSPWLPRTRDVRLDTASDPGEYPRRSPWRCVGCGLPEGQTRRHSPSEYFGALHLQGRLHPLPLHLACFPAYASNRPLPGGQQGWILGSWLTFTQAGLSPAKVRGIAKPLLPPISLNSAHA